MSAELTLEVTDSVAILTLRNPPLNLLTSELREALTDQAGRIAANREIRAVVLAGGSSAFSAGSDIREFPPDAQAGLELARREHACCQAIESMPQPVVAALEGHVLGGGVELAVACDLRVASTEAVFGLPEARLGVFPGECAASLPLLIGPSRAKWLMLMGEPVAAAEAHRIGLVDELTAPGSALQRAVEVANVIAANPALAVQAINAAVDAAVHGSAESRRAEDEQTMSSMFESYDAREGVQAFLDKRPPVFRHH
ncbi:MULTISPECIES: enoyl-CoA hydratase/isomerase family protein [unclassified Nocardioides]|uniref:enoyl-CoA hydratase/isomerase family protein n=1 Tax=unclassified Nocardioides TaxID=2615069 RepID=UPI0009F09C06|nr:MULTISPECIES: enoyl-CoA hydratase-related protein [unclassified Nocardioides]GAW47867.1 Enoyl-CoA hydratase/isomerase [Nocardioides sp. PD653-B2]GAW53831.1 Enoyl-CoA hydratase/isomerase [Nocardioides sp. PD653]